MDRNHAGVFALCAPGVALRKESVDRNDNIQDLSRWAHVALRKESVDRNSKVQEYAATVGGSLSARRAWIEIEKMGNGPANAGVALRKESVDRNFGLLGPLWPVGRRSPQGERG